jgi:hypothetical protein
MPILFDETVTFGLAFTVTLTVFCEEHPLVVPVMVYVVVTVGLAVIVDAVVLLRPAAGDQEYAVAPPANKEVEEPVQMEVLLLEVKVGAEFTVIAIVLLPVHPAADVPLMVYVILDVGEAVTVEPVLVFKAVLGDQA